MYSTLPGAPWPLEMCRLEALRRAKAAVPPTAKLEGVLVSKEHLDVTYRYPGLRRPNQIRVSL